MTTVATVDLTVSAFAIVPAPGSEFVIAATATGLRRSYDDGHSWRALGSPGLGLVEAVAVSPAFSEDRTLVVGSAAGVLHSTDGGEHWQSVLTGNPVVALTAAGDRDGALILLAGTETDGIFRSSDGGVGWASANPGLFELEILALSGSPGFGRDKTVFTGTSGGLYRSRNGGLAWRPLDLPMAETAVQCLALSPAFATDGVVLAGTEADGLLRSSDGGRTWTVATELPEAAVTALAWSRRTAGLVVAATGDGVVCSADGGGSWRIVADLAPVLALTFAAGPDGEVLLAGQPDQGIVRSRDGGRTWATANAGLTGEEAERSGSRSSAPAPSPATTGR
jgi:photosystem II stability/assembly factor-like uncharacterized protein